MNKEEIKEILEELENMYEISELEEQVNNINKIRDYIINLQQENQKYKEVIDKLKEWEQTHTILVYTKEAPRQLVGTHELLHLLYDEDKEVK